MPLAGHAREILPMTSGDNPHYSRGTGRRERGNAGTSGHIYELSSSPRRAAGDQPTSPTWAEPCRRRRRRSSTSPTSPIRGRRHGSSSACPDSEIQVPRVAAHRDCSSLNEGGSKRIVINSEITATQAACPATGSAASVREWRKSARSSLPSSRSPGQSSATSSCAESAESMNQPSKICASVAQR